MYVQWKKSNNSQQYLQDKNPPVRCVRLASEQRCDKKAHMDRQIWQLQRMHEAHESNQG